MAKNKAVFGRLCLFSASIVWGSSFFISKFTVNTLPPLTLVAIRFTMAAVTLGLIFFKQMKKTRAADWLRALPIGILLGVASMVQTIGLTDTTPGKNAFLTGIYCVIVPFIAWIVRGTRPEAKRFPAAFLCVVGIGLVSLDAGLTVGFGDMMTLLCGVLFAAHIVSISTIGEKLDPIAMTVMQFAIAAVVGWIASIPVEGVPAFTSYPGAVWLSTVYLALASTMAGFLLQSIGQKYAPPSVAALLLSLESVFGVLFSCVFYGETLTLRIGLGFAVIFLSILISETDILERCLPNLAARQRE